jgi:hypothetical protein
MIYLTTIPSRKTITHKALISQQLPTKYLTAMATTQSNLILGIPAGYIVYGVKILLLTNFVVPGATSLTLSVGLAGGGFNQFYSPNFELTVTGSPTTMQVTHADFRDNDSGGEYNSTPLGAHDVLAYFTSNGAGYLSGTTQGEVEVTILYRLL